MKPPDTQMLHHHPVLGRDHVAVGEPGNRLPGCERLLDGEVETPFPSLSTRIAK